MCDKYIETYSLVFHAFDHNGNGFLDQEEAAVVMKEICNVSEIEYNEESFNKRFEECQSGQEGMTCADFIRFCFRSREENQMDPTKEESVLEMLKFKAQVLTQPPVELRPWDRKVYNMIQFGDHELEINPGNSTGMRWPSEQQISNMQQIPKLKAINYRIRDDDYVMSSV